MEEERLTALLHGLPHERALPGFTARVLRRLDEQPHPRRLSPRAGRTQGPLGSLGLLPWHRWMAATATVAALAVSVSLSQRDRAPGPFTATTQARPVKLAEIGAIGAAGALSAPHRRLLPLPLAAEPATGRQHGAEMSQSQTEQMLHELRIGQARLERELRSLRQPSPRHAGSPPSAAYAAGLGGDDALDPAVNGGRARAVQVTPPADRDDGEYNYSFLD
jgi:hypothetical protein